MKAQSTLKSIIILIVITGLIIGLGILFMSGYFTGRMYKKISVRQANCQNSIITLVVSNEGEEMIINSQYEKELRIFVDDVDRTDSFFKESDRPNFIIKPKEEITLVDVNTTYESGEHIIEVSSPSNPVNLKIDC